MEIINDSIWRGYNVKWCNECNRAIIVCDVCKNSSCNGGGYKECNDDFEVFNKHKTLLIDYLDDEEVKILHKIEKLKKLIPISIGLGQSEIDWTSEEILNNLSPKDEEIFNREIENDWIRNSLEKILIKK